MILQTLQIEHACLLLVYTLLTLANARLQKGLRGVGLFALYNALALLGAVAVVLRGYLPDFASIVLGNLCVMGAYWALFGSMDRLFPFSRAQHLWAALWPTMGAVSMVWLGAVQPNTTQRLIWYSLILALQQSHIALLLLLPSGNRHRLGWMPGALLVALAAMNAYRIGLVLLHGAPQDYRAAGPALAGIVGANACLQCGLVIAYVWMTAAQLRSDLELQATTDPLTGLLNRRALERSAAALRGSGRTRRRCCVILLDLDHFKPLNDLLGHAAGDQALIAVARILGEQVRRGTLAARTGGDEFLLLLPETRLEAAFFLADRLREELANRKLGADEEALRLTGSFGVAESHAGESWDSLCLRADQAMYSIKNAGGNGVRCNHAGSIGVPVLAPQLPEASA